MLHLAATHRARPCCRRAGHFLGHNETRRLAHRIISRLAHAYQLAPGDTPDLTTTPGR